MRDDLAQRIEAGCAVVTPNRRLAAHLKREYDTRQAAFGTAVWLTADILPLSAFVERAYPGALYSGRGGKLPTLLADSQARELWEETIRASHSSRGGESASSVGNLPPRSEYSAS